MNSSDQISNSISRHIGGVALNGSLIASFIALVLVVVVVIGGVLGLFASALGGSIRQGQPKEVVDKLVASHTAKIGEYEQRFNGRSIFYKPALPPPPPQPVRETREAPPKPPEDTGPKVPATYTGPSIAWVIGDDVYFAAISPTLTQKYLRIGIGEEDHGLKVINLDKMPRSVHVGYQGGEYDVKVFGDSSGTDALFPAKPRASAFLPGIIEAGATPPPAPAASEEAVVSTDEEKAAEEAAAASGERGPAPTAEHPRNRSGRPRGEHGRPRPAAENATPAQTPKDKPDSDGQESVEQPRHG